MIKYDGTVRNSLDQVMQFLYGEDGMAGEYIEDQRFETLNMSDKDLEKNYKFFDKDDEGYGLLDELKLFMEESVIAELKTRELNELLYLLDNEFDQIKKDRDYARKYILREANNSINIPVNIKTIITYAENEYNIHYSTWC